MALVWIPDLMRDLTGGRAQVTVQGATIREVVEQLEAAYPGMRERLCEKGDLSPHLAVVVDGQLSRIGMYQPVGEQTRIRFVPAVHGGAEQSPGGMGLEPL